MIYGDGEHVESYGELEQRSRRLGHLLRRLGLEPGDCVAALVGNDDQFFDLYWACHRVGLYFTPVNWHLQRDEMQYIVENCDAKAFIANARFAEIAAAVAAALPALAVSASLGGPIPGFRSLEDALADVPLDLALDGQLEGSVMLYSSGTTGRPKGVRRPLPRVPAGHPPFIGASIGLVEPLRHPQEDEPYLSPAPLYHAAPLAFTSAANHRIGATTVVMRRFDPEDALRLIEDYRIRPPSGCRPTSAACCSCRRPCASATTCRACAWRCTRRRRARSR